MTIEDLAVTMLEAMQNGASVSDIVQMIGDVEKAERELCASMAENYDLGTPDGHGIAAMIRAVKA